MKEALQSFLKKLIIFAVVAGLIALALGVIFSKITEEKPDEPIVLESTLDISELLDAPAEAQVGEGKKLVVENDRFALYLDPVDTDIAVTDKKTGKIYFSNPKEADPSLKINDTSLPLVSSMLNLVYYDENANASSFSSLKDAVNNAQVYFHKIENGIQIVYKLGKDEGLRIIPPVLTEEAYARYYDGLESSYDRMDLEDFYLFVDSNNIPAKERDQLLKDYPALSKQSLYVLRDITKYQMKVLEGFSETVGFTYDEMVAEMETAGYERDDVSVSFVVPVNLTIDNDGFVATIPSEEIIMPNKYKIATLTLLNGFGATADKDGFMLMPDGSGALIDRVSKGNTDVYAKALYGTDETLLQEAITTTGAQAVMPIFGMKAGTSSLFAIIEEGASLGTIRASTIGGTNLVASIAPTFTVTPVDFKDYSGLMRVPTGTITPKEGAKGNFTVRYHFFAGSDVTYSDMASDYRDYLIEKGVLTKSNETATPFYALMLGSVKKVKTVLGIPIEQDEPLTTYAQVNEILDALASAGVSNIRVQYKGMANEGLGNGAFDRYDLIKALGGQSGYEKMMAYAAKKGYTIYPDANLLQVSETKTASKFNYREDAIRKMDNTVATGFSYNPANLRKNNSGQYLLVAPDRVEGLLDAFLPRFNALSHHKALSLGSMGKVLNSTYEKDNIITREAAEVYYTKVLAKAAEATEHLLVETGNAYTWKYATDILDLPTGSSMNYQESEAVPFVQMILHGYVNYTSIPVNSGSNLRQELLKAIETGSGISFKLMYAENLAMQETGYESNYSYHYQDWIEEAGEVYAEAATVLDQVAGATMLRHESVGDKAFMTVYDNGKVILVNYGKTAIQALGETVEAESYCIKEYNGEELENHG